MKFCETMMKRLPMVVLRHQTPDGVHFDWLLAAPTDPLGLLWAARILYPSNLWPALSSWSVQKIAPHRRRYLTYEGPLDVPSQGRGSVQRIDQGWHLPLLWSESRLLLRINLSRCAGTVQIRMHSPFLGLAHWLDQPSGGIGLGWQYPIFSGPESNMH